VANEEQEATNEAEALDNAVAVAVLLALGEGAVDHMAEVRLKADVEKAEQREHLVDDVLALRRIEAVGDEVVLHSLEKLHREEEEDPSRQLSVARAREHPPRRKQAHDGKSRRHLTSEAHVQMLCARKIKSGSSIRTAGCRAGAWIHSGTRKTLGQHVCVKAAWREFSLTG
jgi:hypothetical protein